MLSHNDSIYVFEYKTMDNLGKKQDSLIVAMLRCGLTASLVN